MNVEDNRYGWPAQFDVSVLFCQGHTGAACNFVHFICDMDVTAGTTDIVAVSPAQIVAGVAVHVKISASLNLATFTYDVMTVDYLEFAILLARFRGGSVFSDRMSNWLGGGNTTVISDLPPVFVANTGMAQCLVNRVGWP
jgi:hypothetical protein